MASSQALSAVARRKAAILENTATSGVSTRTSSDIADMEIVSTNGSVALPLKRKTSAASIKKPVASVKISKNEPQPRKRLKPERYFQSFQGEPQISMSPTADRAYSPSQPLADSSDEDIGLDSTKIDLNTNLEVHLDEEDNPPVGSSVPQIPGHIFNPIDEQNSFLLSPEETLSITGRTAEARVLLVQPGDSVVFLGTMQFLLLQGSISFMGVSLLPSSTSHRVFAPRSHPIPVMSVPISHNVVSPQPRALHSHGPLTFEIARKLPERIKVLTKPLHSIVLIQELRTGVEGLGNIMRTFKNVFEPDIRDSESSQSLVKGLYALKSESRCDPHFYTPQDWDSTMNEIMLSTSGPFDQHEFDAPIVLVRGGKNSGKSTFSRTLANRLTNSYRRVAFIECDLGQSEFTPSGMVSLNVLTTPIFGPPFTHLSLPRCAHFVGGTSPKTSPSCYLSALSDLAQRYRLELRYSTLSEEDVQSGSGEESRQNKSTAIPLVVNTQGWVKGMGADLLRSIEGIFEPSHVVDFQLPGPVSASDFPLKRRIPFGEPLGVLGTEASSRQISVMAISPQLRPPRFSAADLRGLAMISYFSARFSPGAISGYSDALVDYWDTSSSLRAVAPIVVDINLALESIVIAAPGGEDVVPSELPRALVCGIVGLVGLESPSAPSGTAYIQGAPLPSPQTSRCVGLAFIRGISNATLQLLTPTPTCQLKLCRTLVLGELSMPIWSFLELDGSETDDSELPYLQWGRSVAESAGGERRRIRRNVMRRAQA